ncbi:aldehyde dehydrogenase family protein [Marinomonas posidonica]|uniref:Aldehyde Dehydrogenase n=1 Tax=Marinomonas posidonica (strain CECT 7376 / NCIMB 14433 / IVIA-Po-181) TaxID=491952 RepID=F6CXW6_MARPP|nr:aldehyde dehydrogenase family protein [Marinomonas posidonica]AEF54528.1 Aldehyde Dehydrogenase [Marinomonas posidonica IVIA-Po-181]
MTSFSPVDVQIPNSHFIGGKAFNRGEEMDVWRPSDGQAYASISVADLDLVDHAVENAWQAFQQSNWATQSPRDRAKVMKRWADLIEADVNVLAPLEAMGSTRPILAATQWDIPFCAEGIRFFAEFADKCGGEVIPTANGSLGMTITEPYGVVGAIAPWNFPLVMASWKIAPAMAAGNAVVLKPSEMTPFSVVRLAELAIEAGIPPGIFNVVQGDGRVGDAICRHPRISKVTFTGSTKTGALIMTACAQTGTKPVTLELGGKSPQLVFDDIKSIDKVARRIAAAITTNAGQVCVAGSRLLVQKGIADQLVSRISDIFTEMVSGPTWQSDVTMSPIISSRELDRIDGVVQRTVQQGGELFAGGGRLDEENRTFYKPTILTNVNMSMEAVHDEIFGPVLCVETFDSDDDALQLASHPSYGLSAGLHTADLNRAMRMVKALEAGTVWVNRYGRSWDFAIPTGGFKSSGIGKDLGRFAYEANQKTKSVLIDFSADEA